MKIFRKALSLIMVASMVLAMLTVAVSAAAPAAGTKYSSDLSMEKNESDRFVFKAIRKADGEVFKVKSTPEASWSADYPALWVDDGEEDKSKTGYTVYCGENAKFSYDLMANPKFNAVIAFKAPADGYYDVYFKGSKYSGGTPDSFIDVSLVKGGLTEVYATEEKMNSANGIVDAVFDVKGIKLNEGEEVWVVVALNPDNTRNGGHNFGFTAFDVTYVGAEDPGTFTPTPGTTFKLDLNMSRITSALYYVTALSKADNTQVNVKQTAEATWSADWPGFYVEGAEGGGSDFVIYKSENSKAIFDQMCGGAYKSVLAFKAPYDGFFDVYYNANKYQDIAESVCDVFLMKKGVDTPLASKTAIAGKGTVTLTASSVELKKGEEIWVVYNQNEANARPGNSNLGVVAFDVTYVGTESLIEEIPEPGDVYEIDIDMTKPASKRFYFSALSKADGSVASLEDTPRKTWSEDYPAYWIEGETEGSNYVIYTPEKPELYLFDMTCGGNYKSVIAFKAPIAGLYDIYVDANKYQATEDSIIDVTLTRTGSSKALASKTAVCGKDGKGAVTFDVKKVYLEAGEEVWLVATTNVANGRSGNSNFGIAAFNVTYVGEGEREITVGDKFSYNLAIDKKDNGYYKLAGILGDGTVDPLQDTVGISWGDWAGWRLSDGSKAMFCETQMNPERGQAGTHGFTSGEHAYIDMQPRPDGIGSPAIIFTAPKTGTYQFSGFFSKLKMWPADAETGNVYKIEAIVDGQVVASHTFQKNSPTEKHEDATLAGHVALEEGETIMFVASHVSGGTSDPEIAVRSIDITITSFGSTIPNPGTSDYTAAAVALLVLASLGIAVVSKKRR